MRLDPLPHLPRELDEERKRRKPDPSTIIERARAYDQIGRLLWGVAKLIPEALPMDGGELEDFYRITAQKWSDPNTRKKSLRDGF